MRVLVLTIVLLLASACAPPTNQESTAAAPTGPGSVTRSACQVRLTDDWRRSLADSRVDAGKWSVPLAVGPGGEIVARRADDAHRTDDILLIEPDKSVNTVYTTAESADETVDAAELNERWIVLGIRGETPDQVSTKFTRIAVIDRSDMSSRTISEITDADYRAGRNMLQSVAIFGDTAYWTTSDDDVAGGKQALRSRELTTGTETDVESGLVGNVRATATGLAWTASGVDHRRRRRRNRYRAVVAERRPHADQHHPTLRRVFA